ncbi:hypothetical protein [Streptomyces griseoaurantiacus]|uniref:hypothetical protein n=1 Tax=Streptomyces griseoaurantiacus TaxID=68213 RepID=UPI003680DA76
MSDEVQEAACLNPGFCVPICIACEAMAKEYQQKLRTPLSAAVAAHLRERLQSGTAPQRKVRPREPRECPPGAHSMFDFCPGGCMEPVDDTEHHIVDGVQYLCHADHHYCPPGSWPPKE